MVYHLLSLTPAAETPASPAPNEFRFPVSLVRALGFETDADIPDTDMAFVNATILTIQTGIPVARIELLDPLMIKANALPLLQPG